MAVEVTINYAAVLVAAVAGMVLGALWYSPLLFGKMWMSLSGITDKQIGEAKKKGMTKSYILAFVGTLVMAYVLAHFVDYTQATTLAGGLQAGFWIWLGFVATTFLGMVLWEGKPWKLYFLNVAYYLVELLLMGAILASW